jgi:hypothetical protein
MSVRVAQDRVNVGCLWALAGGWAVVSWIWSLMGGMSYSLVRDVMTVGAIALAALYFTYDRWRFPAATLVVDAPPIPGHTFRGKVETPLKDEPSGVRVRLRAIHYVRKPGQTTIWSTWVDAHPMRGERGIVVPVEIAVPSELANAPRDRNWQLTVQARTPFALYRASFPVNEAGR